MARDGTCRGGARVGAGKKKKALVDKLAEGGSNHHGAITMLDPESLPDFKDACSDIEDAADLPASELCEEIQGVEMPTVREVQAYLDAKQRDGKNFDAGRIYRKVSGWLKGLNCENLVSNELVEQYSVAYARWKQCEEAVTKYGLCAKHPMRPEAVCQSPFVQMSVLYMKQTSQLWFQIFSVVQANCATDVRGAAPQDDVMEQLLRSREE